MLLLSLPRGKRQLVEGEKAAEPQSSGTYLCGGSAGHIALLLLFLFVLALMCYLCSTETNRQLLHKCAKYDQKMWRQMEESVRRLAAPIKPARCPGGDWAVTSAVSGKDKEWMKSLTVSRIKCVLDLEHRPVASSDRLPVYSVVWSWILQEHIKCLLMLVENLCRSLYAEIQPSCFFFEVSIFSALLSDKHN